MRTFLTIFYIINICQHLRTKKFNVIIESVVYDKPVTREEFRIQNSLMTRMLVGKWKDQNSLIDICAMVDLSQNLMRVLFRKATGKLIMVLVFTMDRIVTNLPDGSQVPYQESYQILLLTRDEFHSGNICRYHNLESKKN